MKIKLLPFFVLIFFCLPAVSQVSSTLDFNSEKPETSGGYHRGEDE